MSSTQFYAPEKPMDEIIKLIRQAQCMAEMHDVGLDLVVSVTDGFAWSTWKYSRLVTAIQRGAR